MMVTIRHNEHEVVISWCDLLREIAKTSGGLLKAAEVLHALHRGGLADSAESSTMLLGGRAQHDAINEVIIDESLRAVHREMTTSLFELISVDHKLIQWIMKFLQIPDDRLATQQRRAKLDQTIRKMRYSGQASWVELNEFKAMVDESQLTLKKIRDAQRGVVARAEVLLEACKDKLQA
jgi:hypothetical protein